MDTSTDDTAASTRKASGKSFVAGSNSESGASNSGRLQKQRSNNAAMRSASHGQPLSSAGQSIAVMRGDGGASGGFGDGAKARKGSIRNAVKKIFGGGRRGREVVSQGPESMNQPSALKHAYHKSEPTGLPPPREDPEPFIQDTSLIEPNLAEPYKAIPSPPFQRTSSPYAMQFPNSVRLKPMDLGNPFIAPPNQLRRRKTLPSLLLEEREESTADDAPRESSDITQTQNRESTGESSPPVSKRTISHIKKAKRKSRSVDDLTNSTMIEPTAPRKKSEEIRHLRESFQPDVLRASGFTTRNRVREEDFQEPPSSAQRKSPLEYGDGDENTQTPQRGDAYQLAPAPGAAATLRSSPPVPPGGHRPSPSSGDVRPLSGAGTDMSKDLEDRVAKLEAGLQNFQTSLQRLTAERNRRTIVMGSVNTRGSSTDMRSPSMLADTLADPMEPSSYEYEYGHTYRPSTSPRPGPTPSTQALDDPFGPDLPRSSASARSAKTPIPPQSSTSAQPRASTTAANAALPTDRNPETFPMPLGSHPPTHQPPVPSAPTPSSTTGTFATAAAAPSSASTRTATTTQTQPYTFSSLYQMLSDERSARRNLESQLKHLQREIADLHTQVSLTTSSTSHSHRSSYMLAGSSTRLQELLRETGEGGSPRSAARDSGRMVSRFSGSESEVEQRGNAVGGAGEEDGDGFEFFRTPREERSAYSLVGGGGGKVDAEMF